MGSLFAVFLLLLSSCGTAFDLPEDKHSLPIESQVDLNGGTTDALLNENVPDVPTDLCGSLIGVRAALSDLESLDPTIAAEAAISSLRARIPNAKWYSGDTLLSGGVASEGERYLTLVLEQTAKISDVSIRWYQGGTDAADVLCEKEREYFFYIKASFDGYEWTKIWPNDESGAGDGHRNSAVSDTKGEFERYPCSFENANYIRIGGYGCRDEKEPDCDRYFAIRDIEVRGFATEGEGGSLQTLQRIQNTPPKDRWMLPYTDNENNLIRDLVPLRLSGYEFDLSELGRPQPLTDELEEEIVLAYKRYLEKWDWIAKADARLEVCYGISRGRAYVAVDAECEYVPSGGGFAAPTVVVRDPLFGLGYSYAVDDFHHFTGIYYDGEFYRLPEAFAKSVITAEDLATIFYNEEDQSYPSLRASADGTYYFVRYAEKRECVEMLSDFLADKRIAFVFSDFDKRCLDTAETLAKEFLQEVFLNPYVAEGEIADNKKRMICNLEFINATKEAQDSSVLVNSPDSRNVVVLTHDSVLWSFLKYVYPEFDSQRFSEIQAMDLPCVKVEFIGGMCVLIEVFDINS